MSSDLLSRRFEKSVYWNEYETKKRTEIRQMNLNIL